MTRHRWQVAQLIFPFHRFRRRPDYDDRFNDLADAGRLRNEKDSGTRLTFSQAIPKVIHHGTPVMGHQNSTLLSCDFKNLWIGNAFQINVSG